MCGIFGYSGKSNASTVVLEGLKRLEYRGYDSWGIGAQVENEIQVYKQIGEIGKVNSSKFLPNSNIAVGHTRWATHGGVTRINAHPHTSSDGSFVLAQNGIVENYQSLKSKLQSKGHSFFSETDTEVIVRLVEEKLVSSPSLVDAVRKAFLELEGRNTIIILEKDSPHIIAVRNGSPLVVGVGEGEHFFASDTLSFADKSDRVIYLDDNEIVELDAGKVEVRDIHKNNRVKISVKKLDHDDVTIDKEGYEHFMLKEIVEQKHTIREAVQYTPEELKPLIDTIKKADTVYTVGAGTAAFAAAQIAYYLREYAGIKAVELRSYDVGSYRNIFTKKDLIVAVSQSGETADTIEALEAAKEKGTKIASIVNMVGSTITRMSDFPYLSRSGPEICVASTKAFTAQISWGLLVAMSVAGKYKKAKDSVISLSNTLKGFFTDELFDRVKSIVERMTKLEHFFVLGKGQNANISYEGALKIKEISYKHFEGFTSGELKHGVIALIEKGTPVISIVSNDENKDDVYSATAEVKSRGAWTIGVTKEANSLFDDVIIVPDAGLADPIINVIPFQLMSYFLGVRLGNSPDKPRNLAKSVTVK